MYKLIVVDDEEEVRKGVIRKIDWTSYGFEIAGEAENGKEALEIAEKVVPDVVITDIKMPFMDGMELSEILRDRFPTTKVVILTGFDEFEYARRAIKLNVVEYVLKPISAQELVEVLIKVKSRIDEEIAQKEDVQALREHYRRSLPILRDKFLTSLVTSRLSRKEILEKTRQYGVELEGKRYVASALSVDYNTVSQCSEEVKTTAFCLPDDLELLRFAVFNISEEVVNKYNLGITFFHNEHVVILTASTQASDEDVMGETVSALEEIRQSIEKYLKFTVTIGLGSVCHQIENIHTSFSEAVSALDYRVLIGSNRVIILEDVEPKSVDRVVFDEIKQHSLVSSIKVGGTDEIEEVIEGLFKELIEAKASYKDYQVYLLEILTAVLKVAKDLNVNMDNVFGPNYNLFMEMYRFGDISEVRDWFIGVCTKISGYISRERQDTSKQLVDRAREYLQSHYSDSDITIDRVCKFLHISPTYFSTLFKREAKVTFLNYLTGIRMEAAKDLLKNTNMKTFEIAEKVGYSEPNYFSYSFKKNFGISPSEYRNSTGGAEHRDGPASATGVR